MTSYTYFHYAYEFTTRKLAYILYSLVRVSRRVTDDHYASILAERGPQSTPGYYATGYNTPEGATFPKPLSPGAN